MSNKTYTARWSVGNTYGSFTGNNLKTMRKEVRAIALGNTPAGQTGSWSIISNGCTDCEPVASGKVHN